MAGPVGLAAVARRTPLVLSEADSHLGLASALARQSRPAADEALRQSIARGDETWEANLMAAFHRLTRAEEKLAGGENREEWEERNRVFHEVLISACPSRCTSKESRPGRCR